MPVAFGSSSIAKWIRDFGASQFSQKLALSWTELGPPHDDWLEAESLVEDFSHFGGTRDNVHIVKTSALHE